MKVARIQSTTRKVSTISPHRKIRRKILFQPSTSYVTKRNRDFACLSEAGEYQKLVRYLVMQKGNISRNLDRLIANNSIIEKLNHLSDFKRSKRMLNIGKDNSFIIRANKIDRIDKKTCMMFYEFTFLGDVSFVHFPLAFIHDQNLSRGEG